MIDPQDPQAYRSAILDWSEPTTGEHAQVLDLYRRLIALRAAEPDLRSGELSEVTVEFDDDERWLVVHRGAYRVAANLADAAQRLPVEGGEVVLATGDATASADGLTLAGQSAAVVRL